MASTSRRAGRRRDRVNRKVVERHMAVSGAAAIDLEVRPGPGPHFGIAGIVRRACLNRIHVELQSCIRGSVANDDYVLFVSTWLLTERLLCAACLVWRLLR